MKQTAHIGPLWSSIPKGRAEDPRDPGPSDGVAGTEQARYMIRERGAATCPFRSWRAAHGSCSVTIPSRVTLPRHAPSHSISISLQAPCCPTACGIPAAKPACV